MRENMSMRGKRVLKLTVIRTIVMPALVCYYRVVMREVGEWIDASALRDLSAEPMKAVVRRSSSNVCAIHLRRDVIAREDK